MSRFSFLVLALVCGAVSLCRGASMPLTVVKTDGARVEGGIIRLPGHAVQEGNQPIIINAADAAVLNLRPGATFGSDDEPDGGRYIQFVEQAQYRFTVATPGEYQLWQRAYFPSRGHWSHTEQMDGTQAATISDATDTVAPERWLWVKAGRYQLTAGEHVLTLTYTNGARLDRLLFARAADAPPVGDGGAPSANAGVKRGYAETIDAQPLEVAQWLELQGEIDPRGGQVRVELSADGGATWYPVPDDRALARWSVKGGGADRLRARIYLAAAPDGSSPIVQGLAVGYQPGPNDQVVLSNNDIAVTFGSVGVRRLRATALFINFMHDDQEAPLFQLAVKPRGQATPEWRSSTGAVVLGRELYFNTLTQRFRFPDGISVTCTTTLDGATSRWGIAIDNQSALDVCAVQYPLLLGVRVGPDTRDDKLIIPFAGQQFIRNPAQWGEQAIRTPSMRWMYLYDDNAGLYLGDHHWPAHDLTINTSHDDETMSNYSFICDLRVAPGAQVENLDYVVAVRPGGDWHAGADIYRAWAATHIKAPVLPAWIQRVDGVSCIPSYRFSTDGYTAITAVHDRAQQRSLGYFMVGDGASIDALWPTYNPAYGNLREFADVLREVRENGGHTNWHFNWQQCSPARVVDRARIADLIPRGWVEHLVPWPDKDWYAQTALDGNGAAGTDADVLTPCVASTAWRAHLRERTRDWVERYGADGMYYNQLSNANALCGSLEHGHDDYGQGTRASAETLGQIMTETRKLDPHAVSSGDGCNDILGQAVSFQRADDLMHRWEVFHYCFPEQVLFDTGGNTSTGSNERWYYLWMCGVRFADLPDEPFANALLALRRRVSPLLYAARYMDSVGLELTQGGKPAAGARAKWFLLAAPDRGAIVNVMQDDPPALTMSVPTATFGPVRVAWALHLDGTTELLRGQEADGRFTFTLPVKERAVTVLLVNYAVPHITDIRLPFAAAPKTTMTGSATLAHYGAEPVHGTLQWQAPAGWKGGGNAYDIAPGETKEVAVTLTTAKAKLDRYDLALASTAGGVMTTFPHWVSITGALWVRLAHAVNGEVTATIFNRSDRKLEGTVAFRVGGSVPAGLTLLDKTTLPFAVAPWSQAQVSTRVRNLHRLPAPIHLIATATAGNEQAERSLMLYPPIPNGDFERDSAGDRLPDWWQCRDNDEQYGFSRCMALDAKEPAAGKFSLRLDPHPQPGKEIFCTPIVASLDAGITYRVRVAMRKSAADDQAGVQVNSVTLTGTTAGAWEALSATITAPADTRALDLQLYNHSRHPVWFDRLTIEPVEDAGGR